MQYDKLQYIPGQQQGDHCVHGADVSVTLDNNSLQPSTSAPTLITHSLPATSHSRTDGRTDFSSLYRVRITCSVVKSC